jgi:hypothetical protein
MNTTSANQIASLRSLTQDLQRINEDIRRVLYDLSNSLPEASLRGLVADLWNDWRKAQSEDERAKIFASINEKILGNNALIDQPTPPQVVRQNTPFIPPGPPPPLPSSK